MLRILRAPSHHAHKGRATRRDILGGGTIKRPAWSGDTLCPMGKSTEETANSVDTRDVTTPGTPETTPTKGTLVATGAAVLRRIGYLSRFSRHLIRRLGRIEEQWFHPASVASMGRGSVGKTNPPLACAFAATGDSEARRGQH